VGRNQLLLERARRRIEDFNRESLGLEDLYHHCDDRHIEVVSMPLRTGHGCSFYRGGFPYIFINPLVSKAEQVIAGWHEYLHLMEHVPEQATFSTGTFFNLSKMEYQAQVIGVMALMPDPLVRWLNEEEIMGEFGVTQSIARFRLSLFR
jgi:Zn-dependent peptidase ImmA (M78 family)